ncbi:MAG: nucleotidyltransferase domain-containing protein [Nitrospirota bacterium]|nr:nucleotidyltransferase domain-containing protein [Nitrospirota bacterium]
MLNEAFEELLVKVNSAAQAVYQNRLVTVAVYGSVGRGTMRHDSDVDVLIVACDLPRGRLKRVQEFQAIEDALDDEFRRLAGHGIETTLSPVFKTPEEATVGSPLFLDMVEDARILYDRNGFFAQRLSHLRNRLTELGAKRIWRGNAWYWDLKPDFRPGKSLTYDQ